MSETNAKKKSPKKTNLLRSSIIASAAAVMLVAVIIVWVIISTLAWFKNDVNVDFLQTNVRAIDAEVKLYQLDGLTEEEVYQGYVTPFALMALHSYVDITNISVATYKATTQANLAPGNGDYYKVSVKVKSPGLTLLQAELVNVAWHSSVPEASKEALSAHIWVHSFFEGSAQVTHTPIFTKNSATGVYNTSVTFEIDQSIAANNATTNMYYYLYLDPDFDVSFSGQLFSVGHIRITIT